MHDQLQLLAAILAQWGRPVASTKALDILHWLMHAVSYRHTATAIKMASKVGPFLFSLSLLCCCPGGCWGNVEQVVAQWQQHPVASRVTLDMPHRIKGYHLYCSGAPLWPSKWPADEVQLLIAAYFFLDTTCN